MTILANILQNGCKNDSLLINENNYQSKEDIFKALSNTSVHIEIEKKDLPVQFFFDVPLTKIHNKILVLNKHVNFNGEIVGFDDYIKKDLFATVIATPLLNDSLFNLAKVYSQKTDIDNLNKFSFSLLKNFPYFIILNPYGKYKKAPIYFHVKNLDTDTNYVLNNPGYTKTFLGKIIGVPLEDIKLESTKVAIYQGPYLISSIGKIDNTGNFNLEISKKLTLENMPTYLQIDINKNNDIKYTIKQKINEDIYNSKYKTINISNKTNFNLNLNIETETGENIKEGVLIIKSKKELTEFTITTKINDQKNIVIPNLTNIKYDIGIFPTQNSIFATTILENQDINDKEFKIFIKKRSNFNGLIFTNENYPVKNAQIEIIKNNKNFDINETMFDETSFKNNGFTDNNGKICNFNINNNETCSGIMLDDGFYTLFIKPNQESYLGYSYHDFQVPNQSFSLSLDKAFSFKTKITSSEGNPLINAFVTLYTIKNNQKRILAVSITDQQGEINAPISLGR